MPKMSKQNITNQDKYQIREDQSTELLKELHILTRDGKLNQDSRRKLKQIYHLFQFIQPLLQQLKDSKISLVDHGAGKSYLGFILYDLFFKHLPLNTFHIYGVENRTELVEKSKELAKRLGFSGMSFLNLSVSDSIGSDTVPNNIDIVTALHACNTATDDAIRFALNKNAKHIVLVPCCQAEIAAILKKNKAWQNNVLGEIWRHPIHSREFGSHITNVLRALQLEASGYLVTVTELVGFEHSLKNELIIATATNKPNTMSAKKLDDLLSMLGLMELKHRFSYPSIY
jgi:hypothetical protein